MFIVSQDRDKFFKFTGELHTVPAIYKKHVVGINLYSENNFLGTFDNVDEAIKEMEAINNCEYSVYAVTGYSTWEIIKDIMSERDNYELAD